MGRWGCLKIEGPRIENEIPNSKQPLPGSLERCPTLGQFLVFQKYCIAFDDFLSRSFLHSLFDFFNQFGGSNILYYYHEVPVLGRGGQRPLSAEASAEKQRVSSEHEEVRGMKVRW